jgi:hypothetical protein
LKEIAPQFPADRLPVSRTPRLKRRLYAFSAICEIAGRIERELPGGVDVFRR